MQLPTFISRPDDLEPAAVSSRCDRPSVDEIKQLGIYRSPMARYLYRDCSRCGDYLGIILREPGRNTPLQAVNGHCLQCDYRLVWIVIRGGKNQTPTSRFSISAKR
jgi:hypothetical protein